MLTRQPSQMDPRSAKATSQATIMDFLVARISQTTFQSSLLLTCLAPMHMQLTFRPQPRANVLNFRLRRSKNKTPTTKTHNTTTTTTTKKTASLSIRLPLSVFCSLFLFPLLVFKAHALGQLLVRVIQTLPSRGSDWSGQSQILWAGYLSPSVTLSVVQQRTAKFLGMGFCCCAIASKGN